MSKSLPLWIPGDSQTNLSRFQSEIESKMGNTFSDYQDFHRWSVDNLEQFWNSWASHSGFAFIEKAEQTFCPATKFWESIWFPGARVNFAKNLLEKGSAEDTAILFFREDGHKETLTYSELKQNVVDFANYLQSIGISKGDVVCGIVPNAPIATIAMLATTSLGAVWSSASPDFGIKAILDRFEQISPKVLVSVDCYLFKGKKISILDKISEISTRLGEVNSNFSATIVKSFLGDEFSLDGIRKPIRFSDLPITDKQLIYCPISFSDPVYIMFSSGTTGLPKCIVQGAGVLLNHTKELSLHCNLRPKEKIFYYTTCGWMMWNWSQSALALGATLCQFDGNPFYPDWTVLWKWIDEEKISIFGTSAKYLSVLESEKASPREHFQLESLKVILSTGSPLFASGFRYVYDQIKKEVQLSSISGGTDLNGCFALGNPTLPVYPGEIQCLGLGMDVQVHNEEGISVKLEKGELVCLKPFPSMPLFFWNDPDRKKYKSAYFERFENIWCHGDFAEITEHGGMIIYGRSDATLNPGGVRIGTADIYSVLEMIPEVADSVIIGQDWKEDVRIILFVKLQTGATLNEDLRKAIKDKIRDETSPRHVPSLIFEVPEIPYTVNGKKVELAVKQTVQGEVVKNKNTLANPNALDIFSTFLKRGDFS
jgi:acetoacetyl-CoA synthetase